MQTEMVSVIKQIARIRDAIIYSLLDVLKTNAFVGSIKINLSNII